MKRLLRIFTTLSLLSILLLTGCQEKPQPADLTTAEITQTTWRHETFGNEEAPLLLKAGTDGFWGLYRNEDDPVIKNGAFGTYEYYEGQDAYRMVTEEWSKELNYSSQALDSFIEMRGDEAGVDHFFCIQVTYTSDIQDGTETLAAGESYEVHYIGIKSEKDGRLNLSMDGIDNNTFYNLFPADSFSE